MEDGHAGSADSSDGDVASRAPSLDTECRTWANQLLRQSCAADPLVVPSAAWLLHDSGTIRLVVWAIVTLAMTAVTVVVLGWPADPRDAPDPADPAGPADAGRPGRVVRRAQLAVITASALCWGVLPLVARGADGGAIPTAALLFPVASAGLGATICAPVHRYFVAAVAGGLGPPIIALLLAPGQRAIAFVGLVYVAALWVVHLALHRAVVQSIVLNRRHAELLARVESDRQEIAAANARLAESNARLGQQAGHDPLTGLLNRRGLLEELDLALHEISQRGGNVAVVFLDLDRFKVVNDSLGHSAGDQLLALIAARLSDLFPAPDALGRLGGDEFVVVRRDLGDDPEVALIAMAELARGAFVEPFAVDSREITVTCSIGIVHGPRQGASGRDLLRHADAALHRAKAEGKDRYELFDDRLRSALARQVDEERALRTALERGEIVPWYQPIVDARTARVVGAELLARWLPPDGPAIRAGSFIPMVVESGLIEQLSEQVIEAGLADLVRWHDQGLPDDFRLSVNLPPRFVSRSGRVLRLTEMFAGALPNRLTAEITETSVIDDLDLAARRLTELRDLGMTIVLDDFGTGSASLTLLQRVPLDGVKIDRSFVTDIVADAHDRALVAGFIQLAASIELAVTAEGIETEAQAATLLDLGCTRQQGYLHGSAITADELYAALRSAIGERSAAPAAP